MKRSILFPILAILAAALIYLFYPHARMILGGHSMDPGKMSIANPEKISAPVTVGDITVSSAWTKAMLPGQPAGGGFLIIENKGATSDKLISATSSATPNLQIHEMAMDGDVMKMRELADGLEVPAGATVELKPGGYHLMFMDMTTGFKEGESVSVTLKFQNAGDISVALPVNALAK